MTVQIPEDSMHSLRTSHHKINWSIQAHGEIPNWPDLKQEYQVVIRPMTAQEQVNA